MTKVNDKYYVPVEIDGKWWVVENAPEEEMDLANRASRYYAALESCTKYPTLESDSAYWASKAWVKMTEDVDFVIDEGRRPDGKIGMVAEPINYAIQSPTTKELIEQEAARRFPYSDSRPSTMENELINDRQYKERLRFIDACTFALSLPKQDNGDAWDEAWHNFKRDTPHNFRNFKKLLDYFQQHYSISKIK